jgi:hypothetical protein
MSLWKQIFSYNISPSFRRSVPTNVVPSVILTARIDEYVRKQTKKAELNNPAFSIFHWYMELLLRELPPPISCKADQPDTKEK